MGRGTKQSDSIRNFADVGSLLKTNSFQVAQEEDEDDVYQIVWDIMSDFKGRTVAEVVLRVKNPDYNKADVHDALNLLCVKGCFNKSSNTNPIYSMKAGATMPKVAKALKVKEVEKKNATEHGLVSMDMMTVFEKIDWYIWNLMRDRGWRGANEIAKSIVNSEISRNVAHGRIESLYRGNWFQRRGTGAATTYQMRGNVPEPTAKAASSIPAETVAEFDQADVVTPAPREVSMAPKTPSTTTLSLVARTHQIQMAVPEHQVPTLDDGVNTSIWKVMSDYGEYTVHDLATLLADVGILYANISGRMSILYQANWFTRRLSGDSLKSPYLYKLVKDFPMPVNEAKFQGAERMRLLKLRDKPEVKRITKADLKPVDTTPTAMEVALSAISDLTDKAVEVAGAALHNATVPTTSQINKSLVKALDNAFPEETKERVGTPTFEAMNVVAPLNPLGATSVRDLTLLEQVASEVRVDPAKIFAHRVKDTPIQTPQQKKEIAPMTTNQNPAVDQIVTGPMVEVKVTIKGLAFTLKEARILMTEIVALGYSNGVTVKDQSARLIQSSIAIKGQAFSPADLLTVHRELVAQGISAN